MSDAAMTGIEIAVIGMAGRFPGAKNLEQFWRNLCEGVESVRFFADEELLAKGVDASLLDDPHYVKAEAVLRKAGERPWRIGSVVEIKRGRPRVEYR